MLYYFSAMKMESLNKCLIFLILRFFQIYLHSYPGELYFIHNYPEISPRFIFPGITNITKYTSNPYTIVNNGKHGDFRAE